MNQGRPLDAPRRAATARRRSHSLALALGCALLVSCAPGADEAGPAAEDTEVRDPTQERTVEETGDPAVTSVSVDLPGLPIGGDGATFSSAAPAACVRVNWTAGTLLEGVAVAIRAFGAPEQFTVSSAPCSSTPCLGATLTSSSPGCDVAVLWTGAAVESEGALSVTDAELACADESLCRQTLSLIEQEGPATLELRVTVDEGATSPSEESSSPSEGATSASAETS
jgi:hypothetical protein